jgi:hypothetical protein
MTKYIFIALFNILFLHLDCSGQDKYRSRQAPAKSRTSLKSPCDAGPKIVKIDVISASSLETAFYGINVFEIDWQILQNNNIVRSGSFKPEHDHPKLNFSKLNPGNYILVFSGKSCTGKSQLAFEIQKGRDRNQMRTDNAASGIKVLTSGLPEHMDIVITGTAGNRIINDYANAPLEAGHDFMYMVNAHIFRQKTPLRNYVYQSEAPIRIVKSKIRSDIPNLSYWQDQEAGSARKAPAATVFSHNTSVAYYTAVFDSKGQTHGDGFYNFIPSGFNPATQFAQWADIGSEKKLPNGHIFVARKGDWSIPQILKKGVTHVSNYDLPWQNNIAEVTRLKNQGITYNDVPRTESILGLQPRGQENWTKGYNRQYWPDGPLTPQQAEQAANKMDVGHALLVAETMEGSSYMAPEQPMWGFYYKRLRERYQESFGRRGIPYYIAHNYFMFWPDRYHLGRSGKELDKKLLLTPQHQMPKTNFSPGGTLSATNLILEAVYLNAPDVHLGGVFETAFRLETFKHMGYTGGVFLFGVHEWRPNNLEEYRYPDGTFYWYNKMPLDPNTLVNYGFLAHVYGKIYIEWGASGKQGNPKKFSKQWATGLWYPNGATNPTTEFPYYTTADKTYTGYNGSQDLSQFSQQLFAETYGQVEGGKDQYLRFRIDNQNWIMPENTKANDIVNAYYEQRGIVHARTKNGKTAWFYLNPFADNQKHQLEIVLPNGRSIKKIVAGNGIHVDVL